MTTFTLNAAAEFGEAEVKTTDLAFDFAVDLAREQIDVYGARWSWTRATDHDGMPLMQTRADTPRRLDDIYWESGPLIPAPRPVTHAEAVAAIDTPACTAAEAKAEEPTPTPLVFARIINRLRGRSS
ncbi:phiSA1p31-related protein [Streptomyces sp. SAS_281]|uniref:phiSA1p31-related protein n=1 Tax=Streptomyces sp. SAS_281 TaxID=3412744 RepID=UPI00403D1D6F